MNKNKRVFYHLSKLNDKINEFCPRIPYNRIKEEDNKIERICVSDTIEGALRGVAWANPIEGIFNSIGLSIPIRVYEFEVEYTEEDIYPPTKLYFEKLVKDSLISNEYWILKKIKPTKNYIIQITDYKKNIFQYNPKDLDEEADWRYGISDIKYIIRKESDFLIPTRDNEKLICKNGEYYYSLSLNDLTNFDKSLEKIILDLNYSISFAYKKFNEEYGYESSTLFISDDFDLYDFEIFKPFVSIETNSLIDLTAFRKFLQNY